MSPKATEGVAAREAPASFATKEGVGALCETTPSGRFAASSPSRGENTPACLTSRHPIAFDAGRALEDP